MKIITEEMRFRKKLCEFGLKNGVTNAARKYHTNRQFVYRQLEKYDGTLRSLALKSRKPHSHPNAHTSDEIKHIEDILGRNPHIGLSELYGKLKRNDAYTRHPASLFRFLRKKGIYVTPEGTKSKYVPKPYDTPKLPGERLQLDVKYVPKSCYTGSDGAKFYQYIIIDEATRERFIVVIQW